MKDLLYLAKRCRELPHEIEQAASDLASEVGRRIHADLLSVTPVDTSEALSNWMLTIDEPWSVPLPPHVPGMFGSTQSESINAGLQQGEQQLALKKPGDAIFITNNAPHIRLLNDGSSKQAPAGFVQRAVLFGRKTAETIGLKLRK